MDAPSPDTPLLTVVLPVYNVARYLPVCLDSLAGQTRPIDEIIAVDDGSTDDSPRILADYAERLPQMRVIRQANSGHSEARNTGIRNARGRYIAFVDSDDFMAPTMFETLLETAVADDLDMVVCNANFHHEGREPDQPIYASEATTGVLSGRDWLRGLLQRGRLLHMVWMHLYRRDFIVRQALTFIPRIIHEDVLWTTEALLAANRMRYLAAPLYQYRVCIRHYSDDVNRDRLKYIIDSSIFNAKSLIDIAARPSIDPELGRLLNWHTVDGAIALFHKIEKIDDADWQAARYRDVNAAGLYPLLWKAAGSWKHRRRLARYFLTGLIRGGRHG